MYYFSHCIPLMHAATFPTPFPTTLSFSFFFPSSSSSSSCLSSLVARGMQRFQALTEGGAYLRLTPTTTSALAKVPSEACTAAVGCLPSTRIWHRRHYKINANQKRHAMASSIVVSAASSLTVPITPTPSPVAHGSTRLALAM